MSHRTYLYKIEKSKLEALSELTEEELYAKYCEDKLEDFDGDVQMWRDCRNLSLRDLTDGCLYEYGKWSDFDKPILEIAKPVFDKETHSFMEEHQFHTVGKEALVITINMLKKSIGEQYDEWFKNPEKGLMTFRNRADQWNDVKYTTSPVNSDEDTEDVVGSDSYEYQVFEVARILKTFDFDKDQLLFVGY